MDGKKKFGTLKTLGTVLVLAILVSGIAGLGYYAFKQKTNNAVKTPGGSVTRPETKLVAPLINEKSDLDLAERTLDGMNFEQSHSEDLQTFRELADR